jgi:hypothetical protein
MNLRVAYDLAQELIKRGWRIHSIQRVADSQDAGTYHVMAEQKGAESPRLSRGGRPGRIPSA